MKKIFIIAFTSAFLHLTSYISFSQVVINEYSASNINSFTDNFGNYEDWVELYNTTASSVNLTGWYLSNNKNKPTKWQLGNVTINANGFLRIWASGRGINSGANLHASFKLTQCKPNQIILTNASAVIVDSLTMQRTQAAHSRGRTTNGAGTWNVFLNPTPNASNNTATPYQNYATTPAMSIAPGFYAGAQSITLSTPDPNITIRYTTNGSTPTAASTAYSSPINISTTTVLRAKAFSSTANIPASFVASNTYFINITHKVGVVSIFGDQIATLMNGTQIFPQTGIEYFDSLGVFQTESYGETNKHGNDSWSYPQRGIDFATKDQYGYNYALQYPFFNIKPRKEFERIILKAAANDNYPFENPGNPYSWGPPSQLGACHIRDAYVETMAQKANLHLDERTWSPCVMYVNGNYWGVYDLREKVDDADFTSYYYNAPSRFQLTPDQDSLQMLKTWGGTWSEYGGVTAQNEWNALETFITTNNMAIAANYNYVDSVYNVKSLADYIILNSLCVTSDWLNWNTEWWRGKNVKSTKKKWRYNLWDEDATFGHYIDYTGVGNQTPTADPCTPQNLGDPGNQGHVPILNALMQNPTFKQYYVMRYFDLMNTSLSCTRMVQILDSMINEIKPEMQGQVNKWGGTFAQWQSNVLALKNFILQRCTYVVNNYAPCNGATGPFAIKVNVDPPGSGTVDVNSVNISTFVWSANYPGGIPMIFTAHSNSPYCFDHWEFQNHTPSPSKFDTTVNVTLTQSDSIIAHFTTSGSAPTVTASTPTICVGDSSILQPSNGNTFSWSPSTGLSCTTCPNPVATPSTTTTYTVFVTGNCANGKATVTVNVTQPGPPTVFAVNPTICIGNSTTLGVNGGTSFTWSPSTGLSCTNCSNPVASPTSTTTYSVTVSGGKCVNGSNAFTLNVTGPPVPSSGGNQTTCSTSSVELSASGGTGYSWSPSYALSCTNCPSPMASPTTTTTYYFTVSNAAPNCFALDSVVVYITGDCPEIYVPTGFSPNGDNHNDLLTVWGDMKEMHLVIYNRWGQVVFETTDQKTSWDGTFNGSPVQSGIYAYKFSATSSEGKPVVQSGNITVVR
ncbi:MAG: CotH kinase family protein [Bacteroidetes bacterium]|nr:CotH kinase family protein [Bacteroidota bacterium]